MFSSLSPSRLLHLTASLASITPRLGGTPGEIVARDWVTEQFRAAGLSNVHHQHIFYPRWAGTGRLVLDGQQLPAIALHGSGSTPRDGLTAPLLDLDENAGAIHGSPPSARLGGSAHSPPPAEGRGRIHLATAGVIYRRKTVRRAEKSGAAGVILVNPVGSEIESGTAQIFGKIPIFAVSKATGEILKEAARRGESLTLFVQSRYVAGRSANVVGEIPGERRAYIQLAAHYDAWHSGAADNAAGVACILELARGWQGSGQRFPYTLRFVSFAAEEEGLMGSICDALTRMPIVKAFCRGVVSPDIFGVRTEGLYVSGSPPTARALAAQIARDSGYPGAAIHDFPETTFGDHWPYTLLGIAGLLFSKMPYPHYHTPLDTVEQIDAEDLCWTTRIVGEVVERWMRD